MQQRLPSLLDEPIMFAHRGARALAPDNTIESFDLALRLGATGLESDVWLTRDGQVVLDHDGVVRGRMRRTRPIGEVDRAELPDHVPTLDELLDACGTAYHLSLDLKDDESGPPVIDVIQRRDPSLLARCWLCHPSIDRLEQLRPVDERVRLVNSTRLARITEGPERRAARLAALGIDAVNMRQNEWNGGLVALFHRFDVAAFAWDAQHEHQLRPVYRMGIDAVFSDHVDRMYESFVAELGQPAGPHGGPATP